jgi:hypothetical protein
MVYCWRLIEGLVFFNHFLIVRCGTLARHGTRGLAAIISKGNVGGETFL